MNTQARLSELALDFQRTATAKQLVNGCDSVIQDRGRGHGYGIVYRDRSGKINSWGITIGRTRAAAILWLLRHRKAWPAVRPPGAPTRGPLA